MRKWLSLTAVLLAVLVAGLILGGCSRAKPAPRTKALTGTIRVSGAWALYPMMVRWAEEFNKVHPKVRVEVSAGGAGKGVTDALGGLVDIGMVSREIRPEEEQRGGFWVPVVKDAVLPVANASNPVAQDLATRGLSQDQFAELWLSEKEVTWGSLVGAPEVKDKVRVFTRSDACGAAETWAKYLGKAQEDLQGLGIFGDPGIAQAVQKEPLGIGFNNLNYAYDTKTDQPIPGLLPVPIDINANRRIDPSEDFYATRLQLKQAIADGRYPSPPARDLNLLTKGKPTGIARDFLRWILTDGQRYADETGYVSLTRDKLDAALAKLQ